MGLEHSHAVDKFGGSILQGVRTITVHTHDAHIGAHSCLDKQVGQDTRCLRMDSSKDGAAHRSLHPQFMHKASIEAACIVRVGIFSLFGERIGIEPRQEFEVESQSHIAVLRRMYVQVVEGRDKHFITEVHHLASPVHIFRQLGVYTVYQAVGFNHNVSVRYYLQFIWRRGIDDISAIYLHDFL